MNSARLHFACALVLLVGCEVSSTLGSSDTEGVTGSTDTTGTSTESEASTTGEGRTSSSSSSDDGATSSPTTIDEPSSSGSTGLEGCQGIDASTIADFCADATAQATAVTATSDAESFSGVIAFYGLMHCADCADADRVAVFVFAEPPPLDAPFDGSATTMLRATFDTALATQQVEVFYNDPDLAASPAVGAATVSILEAPTEEDYAAPLSERDPPRLRVELEGSDETLEVSGLVDAVYCEMANYYIPCE